MQNNSADSNPEELLDVFKAAALSVTKLFKTSTAAQSKARVDGYQDCLEDLLSVLDKGDVDVKAVRKWILERLDGREPIMSTIESEDEVEKTDGCATPEPHAHGDNSSRPARTVERNTNNNNRSSSSSGGGGGDGSRHNSSNRGHTVSKGGSDTPMQSVAETEMDTETGTPSPSKHAARAAPVMSAPPPSSSSAAATTKAAKSKARATAAAAPAAVDTVAEHAEPTDGLAPRTDGFSFRSVVPYPTESFLEIANLDLSDKRSASGSVRDSSEPPVFASSSASAPPSGPTFIFNASTGASDGTTAPSHPPTPRQFRVRHGGARSSGRSMLTARYNNRSTTGQKRKLNFDEIFDVASLGYGKDVFSRGGSKRPRQT